MKSHLDRGSYVGWKSKESKTFVQELAKAGDRQCFTGDAATKQNRIEQRQLVNPNFDPDLFVPGINLGDGGWNKMAARIMCNGCGSCTTEAVVEEPCCGCACIPCRYGIQPSERDDEFNIIVIHGQNLDRRDLLGNETCGLQDAQCLGSDGKAGLIQRQATRPRSINLTPKSLTICKSKVKGPVYPSYPEQGPNAPLGPQDFDAYRHTTGIIKYMHNSSQSCTNWGCVSFRTRIPFGIVSPTSDTISSTRVSLPSSPVTSEADSSSFPQRNIRLKPRQSPDSSTFTCRTTQQSLVTAPGPSLGFSRRLPGPGRHWMLPN